MSSIGRLTASLLSATNENTLALANLNFDFSLDKFDAPPEFNALGAALTTACRKNAESGSAHKTARRLGALFEQHHDLSKLMGFVYRKLQRRLV